MKLITKQNWLTPFALSCGYIETTDSERFNLTLSDNSGLSYFVRLHDQEKGKRIVWKSFDTLTPARKYFLKCCKRLGLKRAI